MKGPENILFEDHSSSEKQLKAIISVTQMLELSTGSDEILRKTSNTLLNIIPGAERVCIFTLSEKGTLVPNRQTILSKSGNPSISDLNQLPMSQSIVKRAFSEQKAILSSDAQNDSRFSGQQSIVMTKVSAVMCAPLIASNETSLGVIYIDQFLEPNIFGVEQLSLLTTISLIVSRTLENIRLHDEKIRSALLERDLKIAEQTQKLLTPERSQAIKGFELARCYKPLRQLGGDILDYIPWDEDRWLVAIGDVTGKGVSAALLGARLHAALHTVLKYEKSISAVANQVNNILCNPAEDNRFVTALLFSLDHRSDEVEIVHAGHIPPFLKNGNRAEICIPESNFGMALGVIPDIEFKVSKVTLDGESILFATTDGLTECESEQGVPFDESNVLQSLEQTETNPHQVVQQLENDARLFTGKAGLNDDLCMLAIQRK